jgi:hypothetical protein
MQMKSIIKYLTSLILALTLMSGCQKYYYMIPPPETTEDSLEEEDWGSSSSNSESIFISVYGDGDMDGSSWDNAYDVAGLRIILTDKTDLSNTIIYLAEGKYVISNVSGPGLEIKKDIREIKGGYSIASAGTDLSKRDIADFETILSGDVNGNGIADKGDCAMFMITDGHISFEGITFEGGYIDTELSAINTVKGPNGNSSGAGAVFGIFGDPSSTCIDVTNCIFRGNISASKHNGSYLSNTSTAGGPCALVTTGFFRARNCTFKDNKAENRGGAIRMMGRESACFLDCCFFTGNTLAGGDGWGSSIQLSYGHVCANNCTFISNSGKGGDLNGGGAFFLCNNSVFQTDNDSFGAFRCESEQGSRTGFINNIFTSLRDDGTGFNYTGDNKDITSFGYNIFQRTRGNDIRTATDVLWPSVLNGTLQNGCFVWDYSQVDANADEKYATIEEVETAVQGFAPTLSSKPALQNLGYTFFSWVGQAGFRVDQRGRPRNPEKLQKGSYDAYLTSPSSTSTMRFKTTQTGEPTLLNSFTLLVSNTKNPMFSYKTNMVLNAGNWVSSDGLKMMWDPGMNPVLFVAAAPSADIQSVSDIIDVSVSAVQSDGTVESDIMIAKEIVDPKKDLVGESAVLHFRHIMSRMLVTVEGVATGDISEVKVSGLYLNGKCDLSSDLPVAVALTESPSIITAFKASDGFECIVMPQTTAEPIKVSFTLSDISYEWTSSDNITFESGKSYSLKLTYSDATKSGSAQLKGSLTQNP